jgi:hypothetical protein
MGGATGIWPVELFSNTYFGEIIIFELSKDQAFRIWSAFENPDQFLILVTHLGSTSDFFLNLVYTT